jgi:hypothetical protein
MPVGKNVEFEEADATMLRRLSSKKQFLFEKSI